MLKACRSALSRRLPTAGRGLDKLRASAGTSREFQLVLIDFQMPEMDGGSSRRRSSATRKWRTCRSILVTSVPQHGDAARMMNMGFEAYLTKPLKQSVLHDAVATVMGARFR